MIPVLETDLVPFMATPQTQSETALGLENTQVTLDDKVLFAVNQDYERRIPASMRLAM